MVVQTYELYFEDERGERRFEPLLCPSAVELVPRLRTLLAQTGSVCVEVKLCGQHVMTLAR